jgi:hypothetical protein
MYDPSNQGKKWDMWLDRLAGDIIAFVDDLRASGASAEHAWAVGMQVAKRLQHLGKQDAARKILPSSLEPGAWAGAIFRVYLKEITKTIRQAKWDKAKAIVSELDEELSQHEGHNGSAVGWVPKSSFWNPAIGMAGDKVSTVALKAPTGFGDPRNKLAPLGGPPHQAQQK